ncbi:MAG: enoyl-[acyl-carrier protein] reductase [Gaiellales bacterium]|nr:enoyl-[acyl-carrier protein] reductase [Gaiellales bacterium]
MTEGILEGKTALVAGVANKRSIAWAIAQALHGAGANLAFTYQGERLEDSVRKLADTVGSDILVECDAGDDASIERAFDQVGERLGGLDILAHSIAYAPAETFEGRFIDTSRQAFATALDISAYSMIAMARAAEPLMVGRGGGSMVTMTYMASERVFPKYNVMAVAKAALECSVRYLAYELGPASIRVNAISAGPVRTLAAKGIPGFGDMESVIEQRSPLKRNIDASDVGNAALYLCSPLAAMVTGTTLYVDSGYHAMGM